MLDTDAKLAGFLPALQAAEWIALDTEADSLHAYPEKLCLLQISLPGADELIDPLSGCDLKPLWQALGGRELILHGADYDLRLLHRGHAFIPDVIFDTMEAARLIGLKEFGLASLVARYLGVELEKGPQTADWGRRPLTERMESYARNDTRFLHSLATKLAAELESKGRRSWHRETCARLVTQCAQVRAPDPNLVWRVKGSHRLGRHALAVLREIWGWREQEAVRTNRPPFFVLPHETLTAIAEAAAHARPVEPLLPRRFSPHRHTTLAAAVARGLAVPPAEQPDRLRPIMRSASVAERQRSAELKERRDRRAIELEIDPTLIASRAVLELLASDWARYEPELMRWQSALLSPP